MTIAEINGISYELPKYTLSVAEQSNQVGNDANLRSKAEKMYKFVKECIGDDTEEIVDGTSYTDCDLCKLANAYTIITRAYSDDMNHDKNERVLRDLETLSDAADKVNRIQAIAAKQGKNNPVPRK